MSVFSNTSKDAPELRGQYAGAVLGRFEDVKKIFATTWLPRDWADEFLWNSIFDPIRDSADFRQMLRRHKLTEAHTRAQAWRAAHPPEKVAK